jgi:hypothetical protein
VSAPGLAHWFFRRSSDTIADGLYGLLFSDFSGEPDHSRKPFFTHGLRPLRNRAGILTEFKGLWLRNELFWINVTLLWQRV